MPGVKMGNEARSDGRSIAVAALLGRQQEVAKIVQCGEPKIMKVAGIGSGGLFSCQVVFVIAIRSNG
jgi:hypothetical protein